MRLRKKDMADLMELWGEDLTNGKKNPLFILVSVFIAQRLVGLVGWNVEMPQQAGPVLAI